jgi:hypothetical protein
MRIEYLVSVGGKWDSGVGRNPKYEYRNKKQRGNPKLAVLSL